MNPPPLIYSTRDIKRLFEMANEKLLHFYIYCNTSDDKSIIAVRCGKCKLYIKDKNSGRLLFNFKVHMKLKHGVEIA
jgi:hypothetical protein